MFVQDS